MNPTPTPNTFGVHHPIIALYATVMFVAAIPALILASIHKYYLRRAGWRGEDMYAKHVNWSYGIRFMGIPMAFGGAIAFGILIGKAIDNPDADASAWGMGTGIAFFLIAINVPFLAIWFARMMWPKELGSWKEWKTSYVRAEPLPVDKIDIKRERYLQKHG